MNGIVAKVGFAILACALAWLYIKSNVAGTGSQSSDELGSGAMFDRIAPYYDIANKAMSIGLDKRWRKELIAQVALKPEGLSGGLKVLDLATGTGDVAILMAKTLLQDRPGLLVLEDSSILGVDPSRNMLDVAAAKIQAANLGRVIRLEVGDAQDLAQVESASIDIVTMSFGIRNVVNRDRALQEMRRVLKPSGQLLIMEFVNPQKGVLAPLASFFIGSVVPWIGSVMSGGHGSEYKHLGDSIMTFPRPEQFLRMMRDSGFQTSHCKAADIFFDAIYIFSCK